MLKKTTIFSNGEFPKKKSDSGSQTQLKVNTFACQFLEALHAPNKSPSRTIFSSAAAQLLNSAAGNPSPH